MFFSKNVGGFFYAFRLQPRMNTAHSGLRLPLRDIPLKTIFF
jgi:hypothetical protein